MATNVAKNASCPITVPPVSGVQVPAPDQRGAITEIPPSLPTIVPPFDVDRAARNSEVLLSDDDVFVAVPDIDWRAEATDLTERNVLMRLDGIAPLWLVACDFGMDREELHSIVALLQARRLVVRAALSEIYGSPKVAGTDDDRE